MDLVVPLVIFLLPLAYSPGPGNAYFAALGASVGLRASVPALAGYHVATFVVTVPIGLGLDATVLQSPTAALMLSLVGSGYIVWLAFALIRAARQPVREAGSSSPVRAPAYGFWSGAIVLVANPKTYYIIAVMFTTFLPAASADNAVLVIGVATVFTLNNLVAFIVWALGGRALATLFHSPRARRRINYLFALSLVSVAVWMSASVLS